MSTTQRKRTNLRVKADTAFSKWIRARDGHCVAASWFPDIKCNGNMQCCHIISRRYHAVRWDPANAVAACAAHHLYGTHHPLQWEDAARHAGIDYDDIRYRALHDRPMDPWDVLHWLSGDGP